MLGLFDIRAALLLTCVATNVAAQESVSDPRLIVELNTAQSTETACRLSFMVTNEHPEEIASAVFETVLFNADGSVNRQFDVPGLACGDLGSLLINGATTCDATDSSMCVNTLELKTRTEIEVLG